MQHQYKPMARHQIEAVAETVAAIFDGRCEGIELIEIATDILLTAKPDYATPEFIVDIEAPKLAQELKEVAIDAIKRHLAAIGRELL